MPGFYVSKDSSGVGSGLASAIAGIANNFSPKTQAEAENLRQDTEHLNWQNQGDSLTVGAKRNAMNRVLGLPGAQGGEISPLASAAARLTVNPSMSHGGDPYYVPAQPGHPETERGGVDYSQGGTMGALAADAVARGAPMTDILMPGNYGMDFNRPGSDPLTQTDLYKTRHTPVTLAPSQEWHADPGTESMAGAPVQPPTTQPSVSLSPAAQPGAPAVSTGTEPGAGTTLPATAQPGGPAANPMSQPANPVPVPGTQPGAGTALPATVTPPVAGARPGVLAGPSPYGQTATTNLANQDTADFAADEKAGNEAASTGHILDRLQALKNTLASQQGVGDTIDLAAQNAFSDFFGGQPITTKQQAIASINAQLSQLMAGLRGPLGITRMAQPEIALLKQMLMNPSGPTDLYNDVANAMRATLKQDQQIGQLNEAYRANPSQATANSLRIVRRQILAEDPLAQLHSKYPGLAEAAQAAQAQPGGQGTAQPQMVRPPPPAVGTIEDGHRYVGGPPDNPASWVVVQ